MLKHDKITDIYNAIGGFTPPRNVKWGKWGRTPHTVWTNMVIRSFGVVFKEKHPNYADVTMCDDWKNYETFVDWFEQNYYEVSEQKTHLDKDLLIHGSRIYSPETCLFLPASINSYISITQTKSNISYLKTFEVYSLSVAVDGKSRNFGHFSNYDAALKELKKIKKKRLLEISTPFWELLPQKAKDAIQAWEFLPRADVKTSITNLVDIRLGERRQNNLGDWMEVVRYDSIKDIDIRFDDGTLLKHAKYKAFKKGQVRNPNAPTKKVRQLIEGGEIFTDKRGNTGKVVGGRDRYDLEVMCLETGYIKKNVNLSNLERGLVIFEETTPLKTTPRTEPTKSAAAIKGEWFQDNKGEWYQVLGGLHLRDLTIRWKDGTVREGVRRGEISHRFILHIIPTRAV